MVSRLTLDWAGKSAVPAKSPFVTNWQLRAGDTLELESSGEEITLRPARGNAQLHKKRGVWVFRAGEPLTTEMVETAVRDTREERHRQIVGKESVRFFFDTSVSAFMFFRRPRTCTKPACKHFGAD